MHVREIGEVNTSRHKGKFPLGRPRRRWESSIEMNL
jgi:hypothetical protein